MAGRRSSGTLAGYRVVADLNREWESLREEWSEPSCWAGRHPSLRSCTDLAEVLAEVGHDPDGVLGALLLESAAGSTLASRTVLQAMLGKVVLLARADSVTGIDPHLVAMWECIRTYPIERRPTHIPANLALDARKLARRDLRRGPVAPWPPGKSFAQLVDRQRLRESVDHGRDVSVLTAGDVIKAALELELIDADAGSLLGSVYQEGLSSREAARRHAMSAFMVRRRCSQAVRRLAGHAEELAGLA
jgi:DNA-directed RNA polymerase specialized sigma24 family protein